MESEAIHDMTAAYALDALSDDEQREYEEHLRGCERCREELASLQEAASALAFAVATPAPSAALRTRILDAASADGAKVTPLASRRPFRLAAAAAAVAACAAIGVGIWAASLSRSLDRERQAQKELSAILSDPQSRQIALQGGRLVVGGDGRAALVVRSIRPAPAEKTYEIWVIGGGGPKPAGLFRAAEGHAVVVLSRRVETGAVVAVTLEPHGGSKQPTSKPLIQARTA